MADSASGALAPAASSAASIPEDLYPIAILIDELKHEDVLEEQEIQDLGEKFHLVQY
jgi:hypothetical protein